MINVAAIRMQQFGVQFYQASLTASDIDKLVRFEVLNYGESGQVPVEWTGTMAVRVDLRAPGGARVRPPPLAGLELTLVQAAPKRDDERRR